MNCLNCHVEVSNDYFVLDCKRIINGVLYTVPTYVLCPDCYKLILETFKERENKNG